MTRRTRMAALALGAVSPVFCQTANSTIRGRVLDGLLARPVEGIRVTVEAASPAIEAYRCTGSDGAFVFPSLPPATYRVTVRDFGAGNCNSPAQPQADRYKWREMDNLALPVAGRIELDIQVWPMQDTFQERIYQGLTLPRSGSLVRPYGPDLDTTRTENFNPLPTDENLLDSSLSSVFSPVLVRDLPLAGRDIYNTIVLQPGATAEAAAARGVAISLTGQRPSSANFLLDGVENNSYLLSGPLLAAAPESVQEYRFSSNGFSAEYGRAAGVVANVATRAGGLEPHGLLYLYAKHDLLTANDPERKRLGQDRPPLRELQPGFFLGGPIRKPSLFGSIAVEGLRYRSVAAYRSFTVPSAAALQFVAERPSSLAAAYLGASGLPPFAGTSASQPVTVKLEPRTSFDRMLYLPRLDWIAPGERLRIFMRAPLSKVARPDLEWSPYAKDGTRFRQFSGSGAVSAAITLGPNTTLEQRVSAGSHRDSIDPARPEVPFFPLNAGLLLPGSQLGYIFANRIATGQSVTGLALFRGSHFLKVGGDVVFRRVRGRLAARPSGHFAFDNLSAFLRDNPEFTIVSVACPQFNFVTKDPGSCGNTKPDPAYRARVRDLSFYLQDSIRLGANLTLHAGVRVESMGGVRGIEAPVFRYASAPAEASALAGAERVTGDRNPLARSHTYVTARAGLAWAWGPNRRHLLRAGYGTFRDRLFANDWLRILPNRAMNWSREDEDIAKGVYLGTLPPGIPPGAARLASDVMFAATGNFRGGWSGNGFVAVQTALSSGWSAEVTGQLANGYGLPSSNLVNRRSLYPALPPLLLRANQGGSRYSAMTGALRYRSTRAQIQISHTWSHLLDYQSDALEGMLSNIFVNPRASLAPSDSVAQFAMHFSREEDWGSADFDQRHSFVLYGSWDLPAIDRRLLKNWRMAAVMAARTGFPFSVYAGDLTSRNPGIRNRADLIGGANGYRIRKVDEKTQLQVILDESRFQVPLEGQLGNLNRNAIAGPGLVSADISLSRQWGHVLLRADVFNVLNHFNLNRPVIDFPSGDFGFAGYGRRGKESGFPALLPLVESPRQVQLMLRYEF